jgi:hypothetical protein
MSNQGLDQDDLLALFQILTIKELDPLQEEARSHLVVAMGMHGERGLRLQWVARQGNPPLWSPVQKLVLYVVAENSWGLGQDAVTIDEVAEQALIEPSEALRTLVQLEKMGLVEHYTEEEDDRNYDVPVDLYYLALGYRDDRRE